MKRKVSSQRFHIAGSADGSTSPETLAYAHSLVAELANSVLSRGGEVVIQLGEAPTTAGAKFSNLFDWTILECVDKVASGLKSANRSIQGNLCIGVGFSDWRARMPLSRAPLAEKAIDERLLEVVQLPQPLHVGGVLRERQAFYGDILVTLGGGPGVAHLVEIYRQMHKPVIPLDLPLKPGKPTASERLNEDALEKPSSFFEYEPHTHATAALSNLTLKALPDVGAFASRFLDFVTNLEAPRVFFAYLLNKKVPGHKPVNAFFKDVVSNVMSESGFSKFDPSTDSSDEPFLNVEIFRMIQSSSIVVADLTFLRPNCLLELGYALGIGKKVVITAMEGTELPFDAEALPCHFWRKGIRNEVRQKAFREFVGRNINRHGLD